jgi:hypothetical protein
MCALSRRERFKLMRAALAYLTSEWLACEDFADEENPMPSARAIRACRASQMREQCFNAFDLQGDV